MNKQDDGKPFELLLSNEQQQYLKEQKQMLLDFCKDVRNDEEPDQDQLKEAILIEAIFNLPITEQNLFLMKTLGGYKTITEMAQELHITKQTISSHLRKDKKFIKQYVNEKV